MARLRRLLPLVCTFLAVLAWPVRADDGEQAAETFNALFGADLARVRKTGDARDDAALAARLLETAKKATDQPAFLALVCETAANLGLAHPDGYAAAAQAMELVARSVPEKAAACRERLIEIRQKQFDAARGDERQAAGEALLDCLLQVIEAKEQAGDLTEAAALYRKARTIPAAGSARAEQIKSRAARLAWRMKTVVRVADVKALLERDPGNLKAREGLVRLYLVDLDDPAEAAKYLKGVVDKSLLKYVPAAAKGVEAPPELACLELGEWYRGLAEKAPKDAKAAMYARAKAYLERFLSLHTPKDLNRTRGQVALEKVNEAESKLAAAGRPTKPAKPAKPAESGVIKPGQWIDVLPLVDPEKDAVKGDWKRQADALAILSPTNFGRIIIPVAPEGSYELQVKFVRTSGDDPVVVILPLGSARVLLKLSQEHGRNSGLEMINGKGSNDNETTVTPGALVNGREYALDITLVAKGDQAQIAVRLDGKPYINWRGSQSALSMHHNWDLREPGCLGLGAYESVVVFRNVRLKVLSGEARLLRPGAAAAGAGKATTATAPDAEKGTWIDLLPLTDPSKHALSGTWERRGEGLALTGRASEAKVMPPLVIDGSYEFEARIARTGGGDTMGIILPVGERQVLLGLGHSGNQAHGLDLVNGRGAKDPENPTVTRPARLQNGREYAVRARVLVQGSRAEIEVTLDGERIILWRGPPSALSMYRGWRLPQGRRIGFGASNSTAEFRAARLRMLSGTAKPLAPRAEQTVGPGQAVDVLAPVDLAADVVRGTWKRRGAVVALERAMGYDRFMLPATPNGSYSLHVEFVRTSGNGTVTVILPVGSAQVALLLSHMRGQVSGLELIRGVSPQNGNGTGVQTVRIANGRSYALDVAVALGSEEVSIVAKLDGKPLISWRGPVADLSLWPNWTLPQKGRMALGTTDATTVFRAARLRVLSGTARVLR